MTASLARRKVEGKIGTAMTAGLPVVATTMAAEGMELSAGENILIADDPEPLAAAVADVYLNEDLWNRISANGLELAEHAWGGASAWRILKDLLGELGMQPQDPVYPISLYTEESITSP